MHQQLGAEVHYLTKKSFVSILTNNPYVAKVITMDKKIKEVLPTLRQEKYDYVIDLHHNLRSLLVKWTMPFTPSFSFNKLNIEKWLLVNFKINRLPQKHIVDRYFEAIKPLGVYNDEKGLDFFIGKKATNKLDFPPYIALPIGAGHHTKALSIEKIIQICRFSPYPIVLLGGKQEIAKANAILADKGQPSFPTSTWVKNNSKEVFQVPPSIKKKVYNKVGKCSLEESAAIVKNALLVITGDTGLMHIAAAFHKPIISIWGSTVPAFGMTPYYPKGMDKNTILEVENLPCRPCSKIGFAQCPKGHFDCMTKINISEIKRKLHEIVSP